MKYESVTSRLVDMVLGARWMLMVSCSLSVLKLAHADEPTHVNPSGVDLPLDAELRGINSGYTAKLPSLVDHRFPPFSGAENAPDLRLFRVNTAGSNFYIGTAVHMLVSASIGQISTVLGKVEQYKNMYSGFIDVRVVDRFQNTYTIFWEKKSPVFFVPNVQYTTAYVVADLGATRRVYRYQLKSSNRVTQSDGILVLDRLSETKTLVRAYDFYNADWGVATTLAPRRIWNDALNGQVESMLSLKFNAESPSEGYEKNRQRAQRAVESFDAQRVSTIKLF
jgi:hypothetical protein